jgi:ABC-type branched-subunit amino acid transport system ATPase component
MSLLTINGVTKRFRGLVAVDNVSLAVEPGSIFAVIGPNGAGKTTLFNLIAGVFPPDAGKITFNGERIDRAAPEHITSISGTNAIARRTSSRCLTASGSKSRARWQRSRSFCSSTR